MPYAIANEKSGNSKLGNLKNKQIVSATAASQISCPDDCAWKNSGCYAETGLMFFTTNRLNKSGAESPLDVAIAESDAIRNLSGKYDLRLHTVGDCKTNESAKIVSCAAELHMAKCGKKVWTYTHAWKVVDRVSWGKVSVLASVESESDIDDAWNHGYAAAIVVSQHTSDKAYVLPNGHVVIPCPQQTGKSANCFTCRLCWNSDRLLARKQTIAFAAHGARMVQMKDHLTV